MQRKGESMGFFDRFRNRRDVEDKQSDPTPIIPESKLVPFVGRVPFPAYRGNEPYVFVSYAHADAEKVLTLIKQFYDQGYHVWYDEGIAPGKEWSAQIERALAECAVFVVMVTGRSVGSPNVRDEIEFALDEDKPFVAIHLEPTDLPAGLRLRMGRRQAILKHAMSEDEYVFKYTEAFSIFGLPMPTNATRMSQEALAGIRPDVKTHPSVQRAAAGELAASPQPSNDTSVRAARGQESGSSLQAQATYSAASGITSPVTQPKGVAVICDGARTYTTPANSLYCLNGSGIYSELVMSTWGPKSESTSDVEIQLPKLGDTRRIELQPHPDGVSYHRMMRILKTDGSVFETDVEACSTLAFLDAERSMVISWRDIVTVDIDWDVDCMDAWPEYARIHRHGEETLLVPAFSLCFASRVRPAKTSMGYSAHNQWLSELKMGNGHSVVLRDVGAIAFGEVTYESDRWAKDWIKELPIAVAYKDGRHMETYVQEDSLALFALDEFGPVEISPSVVEHIAFVHGADDVIAIPTAPEARCASGNGGISEPDESERHVWGDYGPKGVAHITMADGRELEGVANSFVLKATHMEKNAGSGECLYGGMDSPHLDDPDYKLSDMKSFLDIARIEQEGDRFVVTDYDEEETSFWLPDGAEFWYLGAENKFEPCKVKAAEVRTIRFARSEETRIPIRWCTVRCEEGSFRSPAAFLTVRVNTNRGGAFPSMRLSHEFTLYSGYPCKTRSLLKLVVTKPGKNGGPFAAPSEMGFKASLKNGEDIDFVMDGYFAIYVMSRFGIMRTLPRDKFRRIDFEG